MKLRLVSLVLIAVACGAGLTACGTGPGTPVAGGSAGNGTSAGNGASAPSPDASGVLGILGYTGSAPRPSASRLRGTPTAPASGQAGARATATGPSPSTHPTPAGPATPATSASSAGTGSSGGGTTSFTVPSIPGDNVVSAYGSYTKINAAKVQVTVCAKQTGTAYSVGAIALAYNASGATKNVGAVVLTGPGNTSCGTITFLFYSAHLKVHAFVGGTNGNIQQTGPVLTLY